MAEIMSRQRKASLSRKQTKFIEEYVANNGNGTQAARDAGYGQRNGKQSSNHVIEQIAHENLRKHEIAVAIARKLNELDVQITPQRVQSRLAQISDDAQACGQFGPAVRAEELLGKSIGMWIDQQLSVVVGDNAVAAMMEIARRRQQETIDLKDDEHTHERTRFDDEDH